jgi:hypothetical protein
MDSPSIQTLKLEENFEIGKLQMDKRYNFKMGGAASSENYKVALSEELAKPADASDIVDQESAVNEIKRLRAKLAVSC